MIEIKKLMDTKYWKEIQNNEIIRKRLAKVMAKYCFRFSSELEKLHEDPKSKLDDNKMEMLTRDVVNRCYDFLNFISSSRGDTVVEKLKQKDHIPEWDEPMPNKHYAILPLEFSEPKEK